MTAFPRVRLALILFLVLGTISLSPPVARSQGAPEPQPQSATRAIASLLADHDLVAIGESHSLADAGRFYIRLIRNKRFQRAVDDLVVEFGNPRYQSLVNRYVSGGRVATSDLTPVWRNTTQLGAWDAPMYRRFFVAVRNANRELSPSDRMRVVLADAPIDWRRVDSFAEWDRWARARERHFAHTVRQAVFDRGRKAVLIAGLLHLRRGESETIRLLDRWRPGETFVVVTHLGFPEPDWDEALLDWATPTLAVIEGTWIGDLRRGDGIASDTYNGLLYLGNPPFLRLSVPMPTLYRDDSYWSTLKKRHRIVFRRPLRPAMFFSYLREARYPEAGIDEREIRVMYQFSQCMRDEGAESFPDPVAGFDFFGWDEENLEAAREDPDYASAADTCSERFGFPFIS